MNEAPSDIIPISLWRRYPFGWLFVFALVFRLIYITQSAANPLYGVPIVDAQSYANWAHEMARGQWLWERVQNYLPIYPAFLAMQEIAFGPNPWFNKLIQAVMGSLSAVLLGLAAARVWGRRVGLLAGSLCATNWLAVVYEGEKFAEGFCMFFQSLTLWLLVCRGGKWWAAPAAGVAFALCAGTRANLFLIFPFALAWLVWRHWGNRRALVLGPLLFVLGMSVVLGPILKRNHRVSGKWLLRTQSTWSLYSGIAPHFEGLPIPPGVQFDNYMRLPLQQGLRDEEDIEAFWQERAARVWRENPGGVARVVLRRCLLFLSAQEFSKEIDIHAYRGYSWWLSLPWWPGFWLVGPLGILGICIGRRRPKNMVLVLAFLVVGMVSLVPFKFADRYRLPSVPLLTVFAAVGIAQVGAWARARRWRPTLLAVLGWAALCCLSWPDWMGLGERRIARHDFFVGLHRYKAHEFDEAVRAFEHSMRDFSWDADSAYHAAKARFRQDRHAEAEILLREALRREPVYPEAMALLSRIHLERGEIEQAQSLAGRSLTLFPNDVPTILLAARIRRAQGDTEGELALFDRAIREGARPDVGVALGLRYDELGRYEEALGWFDVVIEREANDPFERARAALLAGYLCIRRLDDRGRAEDYWKRVAEDLADVRFFHTQAFFLLGRIDAQAYRQRIHPDDRPFADDFLAYNVGIERRMAGDAEAARAAFERCLELRPSGREPPDTFPQKWAWEDLTSMRAESEE